MAESREVKNFRKYRNEAYALAGNIFLMRRAFTPWHFDEGLVGRCPKCYDDVYTKSVDANCPVCYGTGFDGGYMAPELVHGIISYDISNGFQSNKHGVTDNYGTTFQCEYPPLIAENDMVAFVASVEPLIISQVMNIDGNISFETIHGIVSNNKDGVMIQEDAIIGQSGNAKTMYINDIRTTPGFWFYNNKTPKVLVKEVST